MAIQAPQSLALPTLDTTTTSGLHRLREARPTTTRPHQRHDPRLLQIVALAALFLYGLLWLDLEIQPMVAFVLLSTVLVTQFVCTRLLRLPVFELRSALISGLSLCLLLRTQAPELAALVAAITIASKFLLRFDGKHIFNPTNLGLVVLLLISDRAWVSPGQWGSAAFLGFGMVCLGSLVVRRSSRSDVTIAFLLFYGALLFGRSLWLGEPWTIPLHRLQNGALLLFAFFMISDPKTTPDTRIGRILFAFIVATGAGYVHFVLFRTNGLLWSLASASLLVPILNRLFKGKRYLWHHKSASSSSWARISETRRSP